MCLTELKADPEQHILSKSERTAGRSHGISTLSVNKAVLLCRTTAKSSEVRQPDAWLSVPFEHRGTRTELGLPDVDQHVGVGAVPHGQVVVVPAVVVLDRLLLGAPRHNVVIEFTPLARKFYRKVILHVKTCS